MEPSTTLMQVLRTCSALNIDVSMIKRRTHASDLPFEQVIG